MARTKHCTRRSAPKKVRTKASKKIYTWDIKPKYIRGKNGSYGVWKILKYNKRTRKYLVWWDTNPQYTHWTLARDAGAVSEVHENDLDCPDLLEQFDPDLNEDANAANQRKPGSIRITSGLNRPTINYGISS